MGSTTTMLFRQSTKSDSGTGNITRPTADIKVVTLPGTLGKSEPYYLKRSPPGRQEIALAANCSAYGRLGMTMISINLQKGNTVVSSRGTHKRGADAAFCFTAFSFLSSSCHVAGYPQIPGSTPPLGNRSCQSGNDRLSHVKPFPPDLLLNVFHRTHRGDAKRRENTTGSRTIHSHHRLHLHHPVLIRLLPAFRSFTITP